MVDDAHRARVLSLAFPHLSGSPCLPVPLSPLLLCLSACIYPAGPLPDLHILSRPRSGPTPWPSGSLAGPSGGGRIVQRVQLDRGGLVDQGDTHDQARAGALPQQDPAHAGQRPPDHLDVHPLT